MYGCVRTLKTCLKKVINVCNILISRYWLSEQDSSSLQCVNNTSKPISFKSLKPLAIPAYCTTLLCEVAVSLRMLVSGHCWGILSFRWWFWANITEFYPTELLFVGFVGTIYQSSESVQCRHLPHLCGGHGALPARLLHGLWWVPSCSWELQRNPGFQGLLSIHSRYLAFHDLYFSKTIFFIFKYVLWKIVIFLIFAICISLSNLWLLAVGNDWKNKVSEYKPPKWVFSFQNGAAAILESEKSTAGVWNKKNLGYTGNYSYQQGGNLPILPPWPGV